MVFEKSFICLSINIFVDCGVRITGENSHYGTPTNPNLPSHIPGGSSSGSAVAVAAKLVDFAIGTHSAHMESWIDVPVNKHESHCCSIGSLF